MTLRNWTTVALVAGLIAGAWSEAGLRAADRTRIFVTFVSHNEESASNPPCAPVLTSRDRFLANRAAVVQLAEALHARNAAWDFQTEYEYLLRLAEWEDADARRSTGGFSLVHYMNIVAPDRFETSAHSHEQRGYNYADVAYLLEQFFVPPNGVVGGFIFSPAADQTWTRLREPLEGSRYPDYTWQARALWGGGSAGHRTDSNASGIWRPKSADEFEVDDPDQELVAVGNYPGVDHPVDPEPVSTLLTALRAGRLEAGRMYTATIMIKQCELDTDPTLIPKALALVDQFADDVRQGDLVWAPLSKMVETWRTEYDSTPLIAHP